MQIRYPQFVYVSNVKARAIRFAVGIAADLADNIARPIPSIREYVIELVRSP